jgi:hypothetical protein
MMHNVKDTRGAIAALSALPCVCPAWARCNRVKVPCIMNQRKEQILVYGNCGTVRSCGKAAYGKDVSPRTGTRYKADGMGKLAQHSEARGSMPEVNRGVVHRNSVPLPGEASLPCFVRFKSTGRDGAVLAVTSMSRNEESAEGVVVATQPVSSRRRVTRPVKSTARHGGRRPEPKKGKQPEVSCE